MTEATKKNYREFFGTVTSTAMQNTAVVRVDTMKLNQKYQKRYRVSRKYHVHADNGVVKVGEKVRFVECRPISKTKRWRLVQAQSPKASLPVR